MSLSTKQKQNHRQRIQTYDYQRGRGKDKGINQEFWIKIYTLLYKKIGNQQGPTEQHKELYSVSINNL